MRRSAGWTTGAVAILFGIAGQHLFSQTQQPPQRPPVFRAGATYVTVDVYPRRDGKILEGLTSGDFQVLEDGKPQTVEDFQFIKTDPVIVDAERRDPNSKEEGDRWAQDPRARVFVVYLATTHTRFTGSHDARRPVLEFLRRVISPADLFGVMTPEIPVTQLLFGRRLETVENELARFWTWGDADLDARDTAERALMACYGPQVAPVVIQRYRLRKLFDSLDSLVAHLGGLRDQRKHVLFASQGVTPVGEAPNLLTLTDSGPPQIGVDPRGRLGLGSRRDGEANKSSCDAMVRELAAMDFERRWRDLLNEARRGNVSFHPIDLNGLTGNFDRTQRLREMADNTEGVAVVNTNDLAGGMRRIADETAAFYLLGYYSNNQKQDGKFHRIDVKVAAPKVDVSARSGYYAPTAEMARAAEAATAPKPPASPSRTGAELALDALGRLRADVEWFSYAIATPTDIAAVAEIASTEVELGKWKNGADVSATVTAADGTAVGSASARIDAGWRGAMLRIPRGSSTGPWKVTLRISGANGAQDERLEVVDSTKAVLSDVLAFRGTSSPRAPVRPVADFQFRRTERVRLEWTTVGKVEAMSARLLDRKGEALAVPLSPVDASTVDRTAIAVDVLLTPLTDGAYVVELTAGRGSATETRYVAIKVVR